MRSRDPAQTCRGAVLRVLENSSHCKNLPSATALSMQVYYSPRYVEDILRRLRREGQLPPRPSSPEAVMECLRAQGNLTRREIARRIGRHPVYCCGVLRGLIQQGLVFESSPAGGPRAARYSLREQRMQLQRQAWEIDALEQLCSVHESLITGRFGTSQDFYAALRNISEGVLSRYGTVFGTERLKEEQEGMRDDIYS